MLALICLVWPVDTAAASGATVTDAIVASITVTTAVVCWPYAVAFTVAVPGPTALTSPEADTVATNLLELSHAGWPVITPPRASTRLPVNFWVCPTVSDIDCGLTVIDETVVSTTVIDTVTLVFSKATVMIADPIPILVTEPSFDTVATDWFELDQARV
jgi:hypothetical protein